MKQKAEKKNAQNKMEKKNKKLVKEELEEVLGKGKNDKEKKIDKSENRKENVNIFTAGLSYEKIDQNKYNKALTNFNHLFGKDLNKINNNKKGNEKKDKKVKTSKKFIYERILYKEVEIDFNLEKIDNKKNKNKKEIISLLNKFLIDQDNFFYYEFSNVRNLSFNKLSEGDYLLYKPYIKEFENIDKNSNNKEDYIKQLDYVNTMNNLYYKFNINKKLFYIITPLYSFSFDYNKEIPLLLSHSKTLEMELNKNDIKLIKLTTKSEKKNSDLLYKEDTKNKETTNPNNDINKMEINEDETNELENFPLGIPRLYLGLFYNYFINQNISKPFNIFSNFEFEGGIYRKCKYNIINVNNNDNATGNILLKIEGIIFAENINKIVNFFQNELNINSFSVRLNKIKNTSCFFFENGDNEPNFDKFDFKKDNYYFYKQ